MNDRGIHIYLTENRIESEKMAWITLFALVDGVPIGSCEIGGWLKDHPTLQSLSVKPEFRNKGYGTKLIKMAIDFSNDAGKFALSLHAGINNTGAIRLYRRLGFISVLDAEDGIWMSIPLGGPNK